MMHKDMSHTCLSNRLNAIPPACLDKMDFPQIHFVKTFDIGFLAGQTMQDYIVLYCHTETTLIMETTVRTTARDPSMEDNTTALNSSLILPE
jgi:hypothetical protein